MADPRTHGIIVTSLLKQTVLGLRGVQSLA